MTNYHVSRHPKGWKYQRERAQKASGIADTQREAEALAKQLAANSGGGEVIIHGHDGRIRDSDTIAPARDPNPPEDKVH